MSDQLRKKLTEGQRLWQHIVAQFLVDHYNLSEEERRGQLRKMQKIVDNRNVEIRREKL